MWVGKLKTGILLARPINGILAGVSVIIGALLTKTGITQSIWLAAISCFFITGGGNSINDFVDQDIDRINKPERPIPSGRISGSNALIISYTLFIIGIAIAWLVSLWLIEMAILVTALLLLYSFSLKRRGLRGNIAVSFLGGLPFVYGGLASRHVLPTLIPFFFAFLFHLLRELVKDIEDIEGDRGYAKTFPIVHGIPKTLKFVNIILVIIILYTFFPYLVDIYGLPYMITVFLLVDIPLVVVAGLINRGRIKFSLASKVLKYLMIGALCSLTLAAF